LYVAYCCTDIGSRSIEITNLVVEVKDRAAAKEAVAMEEIAPTAANKQADLAIREGVIRHKPAAHLIVEIDCLVRRDLHA
jgi:hypothetical protein